MKSILAPFRFIGLIIAGLFAAEMITMGFIGALDSFSYLRISIIDATLMILLATPLLYYFSLRPLLKVVSERETEIAQRKQVESQLRIQTKALQTAANGVIVTGKQGKILWANQAFSQMTGYPLEEVLGKTPNFLKSGVHDSDFYKELWETILSGNVWHGETTNRRKNGTHYINEQTITPVINSSGEIDNFIAIQQDVTQRKQAEEDAWEADRKANLLTKTIHTIQMDIARDLHDTVGQNISYLRMKLDYLLEKGLLTDPDIALDIKSMSEVANESYDMMRGTLTVLQSEDAKDLSLLFARHAAQIEERSTFKIDFASHGKPKPVSANQIRQLFYVFREVLSNIEKHAAASHVSLELTWDEEFITLVMFDNGRGFESVDTNHEGHYGLQFIRDRVELMNGSISIYSANGSGSDIIIQIPYE